MSSDLRFIGSGRHQPLIYSVFARNHGGGGLNAVLSDVPRIADLGADYIWLLPFYPVGVKRRKGTLGSPYAIRDHRAVDPALGTLDDFVSLADEVHRHGMGLLIDIVFNHVAPDSVIATGHPEWLWRDSSGSPGPRFAEWSDVVDLDYSHRELGEFQIRTMAGWLELGTDGFRCDVAPMVPMSFWSHAREALDRRFGHTLWLAETADEPFERVLTELRIPYHREDELFGAFDLCYDYGTYTDLHAVHSGLLTTGKYLDLKRSQYESLPVDRAHTFFLENHDHRRSASFVKPDRIAPWFALTMLLPGAAMVYAGQECGAVRTPSLFEHDPVALPPGGAGSDGDGGILNPEFVRRLALIRRGSRGETVTARRVNESVVAVEWGARRRSIILLDLDSRFRSDPAWPALPGVIPDGASMVHQSTLAQGVVLLSFSTTSE